MEVGKYTYGQNHINVLWGEGAKLTIGKFCSIADNITVFLGGSHRVDWATTYPFGILHKEIFSKDIKDAGAPLISKRDVTIGNDVWIGSNVTIMQGVKIGDGAVIGRNSHVVENVKPYSVVGGNPATLYYYRFDKETISKLLELKWWDMNDEQINNILPLLCSNNFKELFK